MSPSTDKDFPIFSLMRFQLVKAELNLIFYLHLSLYDGVRKMILIVTMHQFPKAHKDDLRNFLF